nr:outer membrane protein assembly factor BamC [uncultured Moellerella sp.]
MATLLQKSKVMKVAGLSLVVLLAACSSDQRYKRQVSGDENYLATTPLQVLTIPQGITLPAPNGEYEIPKVNSMGAVGKELDIRPPVQTISLLSGSRTENSVNSSRLLLDNTPENSVLWSQLNTIIDKKGIKVAEKNEATQTIVTDWVVWSRADEDVPYQSRHRLKIEPQGNLIVLTVTNEGFKLGEVEVTDAEEIQRYNKHLLNELMDGLYTLRDTSSKSNIGGAFGVIDVQSGSDTSGLPSIVVRAPFDVAWERLPVALESIGMKVGDRTRSSGLINVTYKGMSSSAWQTLGINDPTVPEGDYKLQVGDLNNRSSLQFINSKGVSLTQKQNDELVSALKAAFSKTNTK